MVTSPYNALMSLSQLIEHADCVLPAENQALLDICRILEARAKPGGGVKVHTVSCTVFCSVMNVFCTVFYAVCVPGFTTHDGLRQ